MDTHIFYNKIQTWTPTFFRHIQTSIQTWTPTFSLSYERCDPCERIAILAHPNAVSANMDTHILYVLFSVIFGCFLEGWGGCASAAARIIAESGKLWVSMIEVWVSMIEVWVSMIEVWVSMFEFGG
jgi:hypothetical protein